MKLLAACLLFLVNFGFTGVSPESSVAINTSSHVRGAVHAPTGQFFLHRTDAVIEGFEPIPISRTYVSDSVTGLNWKGGWVFFPHAQFDLRLTHDGIVAEIQEPDGAVLSYKLQPDGMTMLPDMEKYYATPFGREISGRTDIRNNRMVMTKNPMGPPPFLSATLFLGNGGSRTYKLKGKEPGSSQWLFLIDEEVKPNGNRVVYAHDDSNRLKEIKTQNPSKTKVYATARFDHRGKVTKDRYFTLVGSDEKEIQYNFYRPEEKHLHDFFYLSAVEGDVVKENLSYDLGYKEKDEKAIERVKKERNKSKRKGKYYRKIDEYRAYDKTRAPFVKEVCVGDEILLQTSYYQPLYNTPSFWDQVYIPKASSTHCEKVMDLSEPVGPGGSMQATHSFLYETNCTKVKDLYGNETHYYFGDHYRPTQIDLFNKETLVRSEKFLWEGPNLKWHIFCDPTAKNSCARYYEYDVRGNVTKEVLYGNLTGTCPISFDPANPTKIGVETYAIRYTYSKDGFNLPIKREEDNGLTTKYTYRSGTDLLTSKLVCDHEKIIIRHFYKYDKDLFLEEEIIDDGNSENSDDTKWVSERKMIRYTPNAHNFPEVIEEFAFDTVLKDNVLQQRRTLHYSLKKLQLEKVVVELFNQGKKEQYEQSTTYKNYKVESQTDPIGHTTTFEYNKRNQLWKQKKPGGLLEVYGYKPTGMLAQKALRDESTGIVLTTKYDYDGLNHKITEEDPYENTTQFKHDRFGNLISSTLGSSTHESQVDFLGRQKEQKDPKQYKTTTTYNARGQPIHIDHPTGKETFTYYLNGSLKEHVDLDGTKCVYEYDVFDRVLSKQTYDPNDQLVAKEIYTFDAFHLRSETDACDYKTIYEYDLCGRKASETRAGRKISYTYDFFGYPEKTIQGELVTFTKRNALGQILEERQEHADGRILQKIERTYTAQGQVETETRFTDVGPAVFSTTYDAFGRVTETKDPLDHVTTVAYSMKPHTKTTTDPLKRKRIETYNSHGKLAKLEIRDPSGKTIALEEYFYDKSGNREEHLNTIYFQNQILKKIETQWKYGPCNRLDELIESSNTLSSRTTQYMYTPKGLLKETIKPDQQHLEYTYDPFGNLSTLKSSDHSIDYRYEHDALGRMLSASDLNSSQTTQRKVDAFGNVQKEDLANGFTLKRDYDPLNQCKWLILPDNSLIEKDYDAIHLKAVIRRDASDRIAYTHTFTKYDLSGNLIREELPQAAGQINYDIDLLGRCISIKAPAYTQSIEDFDPVGKVKKITTQGISTLFDYDGLGQLVAENEETFAFDSNYNRRIHNHLPQTIDDLNQLISSEEAVYTYDQCGNVSTKTTALESLTFSYDALDRLTSIEKGGGTQIAYSYDPLHRRISKLVNGKTTRYLYDGLNEIGIESDGQFFLRLLGNTPYAEIGSSIALEINGKLLIPIHDLQGSIAALYNPHEKALHNENRYTAFGLGLTSSEINPWGYLSKCKDPETGFIFFGRRYYDPAIGRWLTTDPAGLIDGTNLYAYLHNDPLSYYDPHGEFALALYTWPYGASGCATAAILSNPAGWVVGGALFAASVYWATNKLISSGQISQSTGSAINTLVGGFAGSMINSIDYTRSGTSIPQIASNGYGGIVIVKNIQKSEIETRHNPDQEALSDLVKGAGKKGVSNADADTLLDWAEEYSFPSRDDRGKPPHWVGGEHIHLGSKHVSVRN